MTIPAELVKWRDDNFCFLPPKYKPVNDTITGFADLSPIGFYRIVAEVDGNPEDLVIIALVAGLIDKSVIPQGPGLLEVLDCIQIQGNIKNKDRTYFVYPFRSSIADIPMGSFTEQVAKEISIAVVSLKDSRLDPIRPWNLLVGATEQFQCAGFELPYHRMQHKEYAKKTLPELKSNPDHAGYWFFYDLCFKHASRWKTGDNPAISGKSINIRSFAILLTTLATMPNGWKLLDGILPTVNVTTLVNSPTFEEVVNNMIENMMSQAKVYIPPEWDLRSMIYGNIEDQLAAFNDLYQSLHRYLPDHMNVITSHLEESDTAHEQINVSSHDDMNDQQDIDPVLVQHVFQINYTNPIDFLTQYIKLILNSDTPEIYANSFRSSLMKNICKSASDKVMLIYEKVIDKEKQRVIPSVVSVDFLLPVIFVLDLLRSNGYTCFVYRGLSFHTKDGMPEIEYLPITEQFMVSLMQQKWTHGKWLEFGALCRSVESSSVCLLLDMLNAEIAIETLQWLYSKKWLHTNTLGIILEMSRSNNWRDTRDILDEMGESNFDPGDELMSIKEAISVFLSGSHVSRTAVSPDHLLLPDVISHIFDYNISNTPSNDETIQIFSTNEYDLTKDERFKLENLRHRYGKKDNTFNAKPSLTETLPLIPIENQNTLNKSHYSHPGESTRISETIQMMAGELKIPTSRQNYIKAFEDFCNKKTPYSVTNRLITVTIFPVIAILITLLSGDWGWGIIAGCIFLSLWALLAIMAYLV